MFMVNQLMGFNAAPALPVLTFLQATSSDANASAYTFASQNLGTESPNRYIIACFGWAGSGITVSSVTIGGISATSVTGVAQAGTAGAITMWIAMVPTGTTGDIVINLSGSAVRMGVSAYAVTGLNSAVATATSTASSSTAGVASGSIAVQGGGVAVGISYCVQDLTGFSWTGLTENADIVIETANEFTTASGTFPTTQAALAWTATDGATEIRTIGAVAAFR